jgi:hypothetical protein
LANVTLRDVANKTFEQLHNELYAKAGKLKQEKDKEFNKTNDTIKNLPTL